MGILLRFFSVFVIFTSVKSQVVLEQFDQCELTCENDGHYGEPMSTKGQKGETGEPSPGCRDCSQFEEQLKLLLKKFQTLEEKHIGRIKNLENKFVELSLQLEAFKMINTNLDLNLGGETSDKVILEDENRELVIEENSNILTTNEDISIFKVDLDEDGRKNISENLNKSSVTEATIKTNQKLDIDEKTEGSLETESSIKEKSQKNIAADCQSIKNLDPSAKSGVYTIQLSKGHSKEVFCEMSSLYYGWTVIQRRINGSVNFHRGWKEYENGFGPIDGEHWIGLNSINELTRKIPTTLRIELTNFEDETRWAEYSLFYVDEGPYYKLSFEGYSGNAGDSLGMPESMHRGQSFSTHDRDNDLSIANCAKVLDGGGWWFTACHRANLNGEYRTPKSYNKYQGIIWFTWGGWDQPLKGTVMMVRPMIVQ